VKQSSLHCATQWLPFSPYSSVLCTLPRHYPCCDVRYDFRIKTMFGSSLIPAVSCLIYVIGVCLRIVVSNTHCVLFVFVLCTLRCQFLVLLVFVLCTLRCQFLVLLVFVLCTLRCQFLVLLVFVLCTLRCQFLWNVFVVCPLGLLLCMLIVSRNYSCVKNFTLNQKTW
jgi:hypothetical protein